MTRTSPALFLHIMLCVGHQLVIALNSRLRSSFLANSSAGDTWLDSLTNTCKKISFGRGYVQDIYVLCVGHPNWVIALNSRLRSSFLASSSAGDTWLDSLTNTCKKMCF